MCAESNVGHIVVDRPYVRQHACRASRSGSRRSRAAASATSSARARTGRSSSSTGSVAPPATGLRSWVRSAAAVESSCPSCPDTAARLRWRRRRASSRSPTESGVCSSGKDGRRRSSSATRWAASLRCGWRAGGQIECSVSCSRGRRGSRRRIGAHGWRSPCRHASSPAGRQLRFDARSRPVAAPAAGARLGRGGRGCALPRCSRALPRRAGAPRRHSRRPRWRWSPTTSASTSSDIRVPSLVLWGARDTQVRRHGRVRLRAPIASAAPADRGLRPPADRGAAGCLPDAIETSSGLARTRVRV